MICKLFTSRILFITGVTTEFVFHILNIIIKPRHTAKLNRGGLTAVWRRFKFKLEISRHVLFGTQLQLLPKDCRCVRYDIYQEIYRMGVSADDRIANLDYYNYLLGWAKIGWNNWLSPSFLRTSSGLTTYKWHWSIILWDYAIFGSLSTCELRVLSRIHRAFKPFYKFSAQVKMKSLGSKNSWNNCKQN